MIIRAACIQLNSGPVVADNLQAAETLIRAAAEQGSSLIATPEITDQVVSNRAEKLDQVYSQEVHPGVPFFASLAHELQITLLIGSMGILQETGKLANRSFLFSPQGTLLAAYDKIHLYDVDLSTGESHRESALFKAGTCASVISSLPFRLGLSICYDVRFPQLYRDLALRGAEIITVPSAFTVPTGQKHWHILLRARAIETGTFILAPAQGGDHQGARMTYGHSLIISPWGSILAEKDDDQPGFIVAELDLEEVNSARIAIPSLKHGRDYKVLEKEANLPS